MSSNMSTPWGQADSRKQLALGITSFKTPSHGGIYLVPELNKKIPANIRAATFRGLGEKGWYEEDIDWSIVAHFFPQAFAADQRMVAEGTFTYFCASKGITP